MIAVLDRFADHPWFIISLVFGALWDSMMVEYWLKGGQDPTAFVYILLSVLVPFLMYKVDNLWFGPSR